MLFWIVLSLFGLPPVVEMVYAVRLYRKSARGTALQSWDTMEKLLWLTVGMLLYTILAPPVAIAVCDHLF